MATADEYTAMSIKIDPNSQTDAPKGEYPAEPSAHDHGESIYKFS